MTRLLKCGLFALIPFATGWVAPASTLSEISSPTFTYANFGDAALDDSWTQGFSAATDSIRLTTNIERSATLSDLADFMI